MNRYWIAVVSHEHVKKGIKGGFACVSHGKRKPLEVMKPRDSLIYYSPTELFGVKKPLQQFTALCVVKDKPPYEKKLFSDFTPWARDVEYAETRTAPIKELINELSFITNKRFWGMSFRRGVFSIPKDDFDLIVNKMRKGV